MKLLKNKKTALFLIIILGFLLRFFNLNWDNNFHLHPDERFLTMVGDAMQLPKDFTEYLNPSISKFNPENVNYEFFVYGILPLTINKIIALPLNNNTYDLFTIQGRFISAALDFLIIILLFRSVQIFERKLKFSESIKYFSAFFYAISVLPIQLSHFYTVDTFLNSFIFLSFYLTLEFWGKRNLIYVLLSAIFVGMAIASKINGLAIIPLNLTIISLAFLNTNSIKDILKSLKEKEILKIIFTTLVFIIFAYLSARISNPYIFQNSSFLDLRISETFINNINSLKSLSSPETTFPPSLQWIRKPPILFSIFNLSIFGIGIPIFLLTIFGIILSFIKKKYFIFLVISLWTILLFIYQSMQFVQTMRYLLYLYPFFAIFAGIGIYELIKKLKGRLTLIIILLSIIWPLMFISIYIKPHTRITASEWIYKNIKPDAKILAEHWDDPLPLPLNGKFYTTIELPVFHSTSKEGWEDVDRILQEADYLVLSSGRSYESILNVKKKYPELSKFYEDLFNERTSYKKVAEFTSYPSLNYLGIPITLSDDSSEEAFRVYDHPKVMIFKR